MPRVPGLAQALSAASAAARGGDAKNSEISNDGRSGEAGNGLAAVEQEREEQRKKKNVNRSLQRLKEQIKAEKLRKRTEVRRRTQKITYTAFA